jgi:hypothetical protein
MGRFNKVSLLAGMLLAPVLLLAQFNNNTTSPYSRYGLGDLHSYDFGRTTAMGGAAFASRNSQQINAANPASYTAVDSLSFLFEFGVFGKFANFSNDIGSMNANDINFRYFAMSFQIKNWLATSLGLTPYSDVGYDVETSQTVDVVGDVLHRYYGTGSLSKAYWGVAMDPLKNVSVGFNLNYIFGALTQNSEQYALQVSDFDNLQKYENTRLSDFGLTFGVQATLPVKENDRLTIGAVLESKPKYTAYYSDLTQKIVAASSSYDTLSIYDEEKFTIEFPFTFGLGLSYVKPNRLEINADYYFQGWSDAKFNYPGAETDGDHRLTNLNKFALGGEWIPNRFSIGSYLNRVAYRAGLKYEETYLELDDQQINDFGISFGVGLPVYRSNSTINISAEIGRRGTTKNNLVLEKYAKLNLSVNLYDIWFIQRRYD